MNQNGVASSNGSRVFDKETDLLQIPDGNEGSYQYFPPSVLHQIPPIF